MKSRAYDDQASNALGEKLTSGEPVAVKVARRVRRGVSGDVPSGNAPGTYPTIMICPVSFFARDGFLPTICGQKISMAIATIIT